MRTLQIGQRIKIAKIITGGVLYPKGDFKIGSFRPLQDNSLGIYGSGNIISERGTPLYMSESFGEIQIIGTMIIKSLKTKPTV